MGTSWLHLLFTAHQEEPPLFHPLLPQQAQKDPAVPFIEWIIKAAATGFLKEVLVQSQKVLVTEECLPGCHSKEEQAGAPAFWFLRLVAFIGMVLSLAFR